MIPYSPGEVQGLQDMWADVAVGLESPRQGGGFEDAGTVQAQIQERATSVVDARTGGLLQVQTAMLLVPKDTEIAAGWRVTRADTEQVYLAGVPIDNATAPRLKVPLKGARG